MRTERGLAYFWIGALGWLMLENVPLLAQSVIVPDEALGSERSQPRSETIRGVDSDRIEGGARRGGNLFHSFTQFDVGAGQGAYFSNPTGVENIFSRITGNVPSNIQGTLGVIQEGSTEVLGNANLFLINPNGIVFGAGARLDLGGSFVGTTADGVGFGDRGVFGSLSPEVPSQLLTINPSAFLFSRVPAQIKNNSTDRNSGLDPSGRFNPFGLRVPDGQSLLLLGGDINIDGGGIAAFGGQIELGSLGEPGLVGFSVDGDRFNLDFSETALRADVTLTDNAGLIVAAGGDGNVGITARNVDILQGSTIQAGILRTLGSPTAEAGDIKINATDTVTVANSDSHIYNVIFPNGTSTGGDITIKTRRLLVDSAQVSASTFGRGDAGNLTVRASDSVDLRGETPGDEDGSPGGLFAQVESTGIGEGGNLTLRTNHLSVSDGSKIQVATFGQGNAGDLFIDADTINVFDTERYNFYSTGIIADVSTDASEDNRPTGTGNGGNVTIETGRLTILGGQVTADTDGKGNAGTLRVNARDSIEIGRTSPSSSRGFLTADVNEGATGQGGTLIIETGDLIIRDNGRVSTNTDGTGNAGDLTIIARNVNVEGSQISSSTSGRGNAGNLSIRASDSIVLSGENPGVNGGNRSPGGLFAQVNSTGVGEGGNLTLRTNRLSVGDGSKIQVATFGQGDAGNLIIRANAINVRETRRPNSFTTGIFAGIQTDPQSINPPIGNGGRVAIRTNRLRINGGEISANTAGQGNAGRLSIRARDRIDIIGTSPEIGRASLISTDVAPNATGRGGQISINTRQLNVREDGRISARTEGQRRAGNIVVRSDELSLLNGTISTATTSQSRGRGGDIRINTEELRIDDRSRITASTQGQGRSGNVSITSDNISVSDGGRILTSTSSSNRSSRAGDITIQNSGDMNLNGRRSRIFTGTELNTTANGGNVDLATDALNISDRARISAQSNGTGRAGDITINASGQAQLTNGNIITSATRSSGGNIQINGNAPIVLEGNSQVTTDSRGNGGNISLDAPSIVAFDTSDILARSRVERGGGIELAPFFGEGYQPNVPVESDRINVNASGGLEDGNIQTPDTSFVQNSLANIPEAPINTDRLLANSCIVRDRQQGQFTITGSGGLPNRPGNSTVAYPTGAIAPVPTNPSPESSRRWQMGDAIQEPQGVYKLPDGRLVISRECDPQPQ